MNLRTPDVFSVLAVAGSLAMPGRADEPLPAPSRNESVMIRERTEGVLAADIDSAIDWQNGGQPFKAGWQRHIVARLSARQQKRDALFQLVSAPWGHDNAQMPSMVYMPEKKRLLMVAYGRQPGHTIVTCSDDFGASWTKAQSLLNTEGTPFTIGVSIGLTYLGRGKLLLGNDARWHSTDYGATWAEYAAIPKAPDGSRMESWDPILIDRDKKGSIVRMLEARWKPIGRRPFESGSGPYSQGYIWSSVDIGRSWSEAKLVPQWLGVNEVAMVRARNGDIIAACRTDNPERYIGREDLFSGLGVSVSRDNGATWSNLNMLFEFGRHHPSLVRLKNGTLVMTYAVRMGYKDQPDGYGRYGIEAVISKDNGVTWDLRHRYVLATWRSKILDELNAWWGSSQSTSTLLLPDGSLITAFGTGLRNRPDQTECIMDLAVVKWRL